MTRPPSPSPSDKGRRAALLLALILPGCTLIDQRTFERDGAGPDAAAITRSAASPKLPLVTIRFDDPDADFRPALADAIDAAQSAKPSVEFDVVAPIPTKATQAVQDRFAAQGKTDTATVAEAFGYAGILLDRVHVGLRGDPGDPPREVLVFVR